MTIFQIMSNFRDVLQNILGGHPEAPRPYPAGPSKVAGVMEGRGH